MSSDDECPPMPMKDETKKKIAVTRECCNPFDEKGHSSTRKQSLRNVTKQMVEVHRDLQLTSEMKICDRCRKQLQTRKRPHGSSSDDSNHPEQEQQECDMDVFSPEPAEKLQSLNESLVSIGQSPVEPRQLRSSKAYAAEKLQKVSTSCKKLFEDVAHKKLDEPSPAVQQETDAEIIQQLKEEFSKCELKSRQIQLLTVLPKSWSTRKIQEEFGISNRKARLVKKTVAEKGILGTPNRREGTFPEETVKLVKDFYKSQEISREMPGIKDFKSVKENGERKHKQKHLVLCNLREAHLCFKEKLPDVKISLSKFAELRPPECILAGKAGTHSVCVCTIHQNFKLMLEGSGLVQLTEGMVAANSGKPMHMKDYHHCLKMASCEEMSPACSLNQCKECSGVEELKQFLEQLLEENMIDQLTYKTWSNKDGFTTLDTVIESDEAFTESFCQSLLKLRIHDFIAKEQHAACSERKENLNPGEILVVGDFSENYSFVVQDAAQGWHWNNTQATLHPWVCYYKEMEEVKVVSLVIISECLIHNAVAVKLFQKKLVEFLKGFLPFEIKKMIYWSDGAASQYKNRKNFLNLCMHQKDYGIDAEWHCFATSHGKGPSDGLGGTVKRLAKKRSLQKTTEKHIMNPKDLHEFVRDNTKMNCIYCTSTDYENEAEELADRLQAARAIPGTQKIHCFIPTSEFSLVTKLYSRSSVNLEVSVTDQEIQEAELGFDQIKDYVTVEFGDEWFLGFVLQKFQNKSQLKVKFLTPSGPASSFKFPPKDEVWTVEHSQILSIVEPLTATGRTYRLTEKEMNKATIRLEQIS